MSVAGKVPLHLEGLRPPDREENVGLLIREIASARSVLYLPTVAAASPELGGMLQEVDCIFFDGTFWSSDELMVLGVGQRRAEDMAHWPIGGPRGSLQMLSKGSAPYRIFIHINNTNPILREDSLEWRQVNAAGIAVAYDGMDIKL
jgi:pyrroloquinoline quinone biosynthesis protein B